MLNGEDNKCVRVITALYALTRLVLESVRYLLGQRYQLEYCYDEHLSLDSRSFEENIFEKQISLPVVRWGQRMSQIYTTRRQMAVKCESTHSSFEFHCYRIP